MSAPGVLPGNPPGTTLVTMALHWIRTIAVDHPWVRIPPHAWAPGDLIVAALPNPINGPVTAMAGWTLMPDTSNQLAYRIAVGDELESVLLAIRFVTSGDDGPEPTADPNVNPDPEP